MVSNCQKKLDEQNYLHIYIWNLDFCKSNGRLFAEILNFCLADPVGGSNGRRKIVRNIRWLTFIYILAHTD